MADPKGADLRRGQRVTTRRQEPRGDRKGGDLRRGQRAADRNRAVRAGGAAGALLNRALRDPVGLALGAPPPEVRNRLLKLDPTTRAIVLNQVAGPPRPFVNVKVGDRTSGRTGLFTPTGRPRRGATALDPRTMRMVRGTLDERGTFIPDPTNIRDTALSANKIFSDLIEKAKKQIDKGVMIPNTGAGPGIGFATSTPTALSPGATNIEFANRVAKDALTIPQVAPTALYELLAAGLDLTGGDTAKARKLASELKESVTYKLLSGDVKGALKLAEEHPGFAALEALGVEGVIGRGLGGAARLAPSDSTLGRVGSTQREPLKVWGDILDPSRRDYSRDLLKKGLQVLGDRNRRARNVRAGRDPQQMPAGPLQTHLLRRDVAVTNDQNIERVRAGRKEDEHLADDALPKEKRNPVMALMTEGRVDVSSPEAFRRDLTRIVDRLDAIAADPEFRARPNKLEGNRQQAAIIRSALANPKLMADPRGAAAALRSYVTRNVELDRESAAVHYIDPERQERASLVAAAVEHRGAEFDPDPRPTQTAQEKRLATRSAERAQKNLGEAKRERAAAKTVLERVIADARVSEARYGGVDPRTADRLLAAIGRHDEAKARVAAAKRVAERAESRRKEAKRAASGRPKTFIPGIVDPDTGERIPNEAIRALLSERGIEDVAFLGQRPFVSDAGKNYMGSGNKGEDRPQVSSTARTGAAVREGTYDISRDALITEQKRKRVVIETTKAVNRTFNRYGTGEFKDPTSAREAADAIQREGGPEMVVVSMRPGILSTRPALEGIDEHIDVERIEDVVDAMGLSIGKAIVEKGNDPGGPYTLMPRAVTDTFAAFEKLVGTGDPLKALEAFTGNFRQVVLATSTRWVFGNVSEAVVRGASAGIGPQHILIGRKLANRVKNIDPERGAEAYADLTVTALTGGPASQAVRINRHRAADQFDRNGILGMTARGWDAAWAKPGPKQMRDTWHVWKAGVFAMNHVFERALEYGAIGKLAMKDIDAMNTSWGKALRASDAAIDDLARGLLDTENQRRYALFVDDVRGRYSKFGPGMKAALFYYAPFAAWYINALKFCIVTLPAHRPIQTGFLGAYANAHEELIQMQAALTKPGGPRFMGGAVTTEANGVLGKALAAIGSEGQIPLQRYLPFSALSSDPLAMPKSQLLPHLGFLDNWAGFDFTGRKLMIDGEEASDGDRFMVGLWSLADTMVPFAIPIQRVFQKGGTPAPTMTNPFATKPGTSKDLWEGVKKTVNPLYPYSGKRAAAAPKVSDKEREMLLREARSYAPTIDDEEREMLLREARIAAGG